MVAGPPPSRGGKTAALGAPIPYLNPHALSVSLPTWEDNVGWASANKDTVDAMSTGYPRFFIHRTIQKLANSCLERAGTANELCMLFPTARTAYVCRSYMSNRVGERAHMEIRIVDLTLGDPHQDAKFLGLHAVLFPSHMWKFAKSCWQHAGMGISSRYAEACLSWILQNSEKCPMPKYPIRPAVDEKLLLRKRIATLVSYGEASLDLDRFSGKRLPSEHDVFLYPTGMSAIWHTHQLTLNCKPGLKSVCLGFPYTDTLKILEKWGPGCYFYGHDPDSNLAAFEAFLASPPPSNGSGTSYSSPVSAVFCECPSNPLLQSPNLLRLRQLADQYSFLICIDETIGNFVNTDLLDYADVIMTSLSKLFSGKADVMGGSVVINPNSPHYDFMRHHMHSSFVDDYFGPDAIQMEMNSRDFASRVNTINANARAVCDFLRSRSLSFATSSPPGSSSAMVSSPLMVIKEVFYPEWITPANYGIFRRPGKDDNFGPLFSITFISHATSEAFYNALLCAKGPSLGTDFTLACPYTILAHFQERDWAAEYGVEEGIVRVSVGMEERETLMEWFRLSLEAAEKVAYEDAELR